MAIVIDDHLLLEVLAGIESPALSEELRAGVVFTTGCWYYRLSRAVRAGSGAGSLSGRLAGLEPSQRDRALLGLQDLPSMIGLLSYRTLVPVMAALRVRRPLNMLNADALAVALVVDGAIRVRVLSALLSDGARDLDVDYEVRP